MNNVESSLLLKPDQPSLILVGKAVKQHKMVKMFAISEVADLN